MHRGSAGSAASAKAGVRSGCMAGTVCAVQAESVRYLCALFVLESEGLGFATSLYAAFRVTDPSSATSRRGL